MNYAAIEHYANSIYCYARTEDELIINLKTGYEVERVFIYYGDPYSHGILGSEENWCGSKEEIIDKKELAHELWWSIAIKPKYKRVKYYFEIETKDERAFLFEDGIISHELLMRLGNSRQCFVCPWMNKVDLNTTPAWVNSVVWYQIFIDRFERGSNENKPLSMKEWKPGKIDDYHDVFGGDLRGIINRLDYLQALGITGLYLTPVFEAYSNHKYDPTDYKKVDPIFGSNDDLKELVQKCHKRGIKVMLDGVFNHVGRNFPFWNDVLEKGRDSKYFDWFLINTWPLDFASLKDTKGGEYYSFGFYKNMPKLNTSNKEVRDYLLDICEYWLEEFDIDALRLDVANEISHKFNKELRSRLCAKKNDFYLIGEIWHHAGPWLEGDEFHAVMNYPLNGAIQDFFLNPTATKIDFEHFLNRCFTMYQQQVNDVLFNLLDSHDTDRLFTRVNENMDTFISQMAVLFTMPGTCCLYYGSEVCLTGSHDPDNRGVMPWNDIDSHKYDAQINLLKSLIRLRQKEIAARSQNFLFSRTIKNKRVVEYLKMKDDEALEVLINASSQLEKIKRENILFAYKYEQGKLLPGGVLISKRGNIHE